MILASGWRYLDGFLHLPGIVNAFLLDDGARKAGFLVKHFFGVLLALDF